MLALAVACDASPEAIEAAKQTATQRHFRVLSVSSSHNPGAAEQVYLEVSFGKCAGHLTVEERTKVRLFARLSNPGGVETQVTVDDPDIESLKQDKIFSACFTE